MSVLSCSRSPKSWSPLPTLAFALAGLGAPHAAVAQAAVLTQNGDNARTGANTAESTLSPANVKAGSFGKLFTIAGLNANVNGQVLYAPAVTVKGAVHNALLFYTSNNNTGSACGVYAYDADTGSQLWFTALPASAQYTTATPVIDPATRTMYVLTKSTNDSGPTYLRAFDITSGAQKSSVQIAATAAGTGAGSVNNVVHFDGPASNGGTFHANDRAGLLLLNGVVYVSFAFNSDAPPYHGWILGYDAATLTQKYVFCTTPNGSDGGVWMAGKGLVADTAGNIYCSVGNGTFDASTGGIDYGMCYLKLSPALKVLDYFSPYDELAQSNSDLDIANSGPVGIPGTTRLFAGATKFGTGFLYDSVDLGQFVGPNKPAAAGVDGVGGVVQRLDGLSGNDNVGQNPVALDAGGVKYVYLWPDGHGLEQFQYDPTAGPADKNGQKGQFSPAGIFKQSSLSSGGSLAVSANGTGDAILWAVGPHDNGSATLSALNANDVSQAPYYSDSSISSGHFQFPTVANGKVYVPTGSASITVYGLLSPAATAGNVLGVRWGMQDSGIGHQVGEASADGWSADTLQDSAGFMQYGPYVTHITPGPQTASWELSVDNNTYTGDTGPVVELQVYDTTTNTLLATRDVLRHEWLAANQSQTFSVPFTLPAVNSGDIIELRNYWFRRSYVDERGVSVTSLTWPAQDSALGHVIGRPDGSGWSASTAQDPVGFLQFGPYVTRVTPGSRVASWGLEVDNNTYTGDGGPVLELQAYDYDKNTLLATRDVNRSEWAGAYQYQNFSLPFTLPSADAGDRIEMRVFWFRRSYVNEKSVSVQ